MQKRLLLCQLLAALLVLTHCTEERGEPLAQLGKLGYSLSIAEFHRAARQGDCAALGLMLQAGLSVNVTDKDGHTALHEAAGAAHEEAVELLLQAGASTFIGKHGSLAHAVKGRSTAILRSLLLRDSRLSADAAELLPQLCKTGPYQAVQALLTTAQIPASLPALLAAADGGDTAVIDLLMQSGASPWQQAADSGKTALMVAAQHGHSAAVELLLNAGSNRFSADAQGFCAKDHASSEALKQRLSTEPTAAEKEAHHAVERRAVEGGLTELRNQTLPRLIRLDGCQIPARSEMLPEDALFLKRVNAATLPCRATQLTLQSMTLEDGRVIKPGEELLGGWKLLLLRQRTDGPEWWRLEALVSHDASHQRQLLIPGLPLRSGGTLAEIGSSMSASHEYECQVGDSFQLAESSWRVTQLCPDRVIVTHVTTGRTSAIRWKGKN